MNFFKEHDHIHFIGIGGIGMSGLARLLLAQGKTITGSDLVGSELTDELENEGIELTIGHHAENISEDVSLVVYSEAIPLENPERQAAKVLEIPSMNYFEALGEFAKDYQLLAVAGSHGKTTTTAMLALILIEAGLDPTVLVGSKVKEFRGKNVHEGSGGIFLVEACEYRRNFLSLEPDLLGITNIDLDHLDYFKNEEDYRLAFETLAAKSREVLWPEDTSEYEGEVGVPGEHNLRNAGLAAAMARRLGVKESVIAQVLANYQGVWRRFEFKGTCNGALVYDDYAHHPAEIIATLQAARERHPEERIVAVFQPHQHSRVRHFLGEFAEAFEDADEVIIPSIYAARDTKEDQENFQTDDLVDAIAEHHDDVKNGEGLKATADYLQDTLQEGDVLLVMGAGDVDSFIPLILDA